MLPPFLRLPHGRLRRRLLTIALAATALGAGGGGTALAVLYASDHHDIAGKIAFDQQLPIPSLARSTVADGTRVFRLDLPAKMDGGPHQPVAAGATWSPHWQIRQPAATLWYHLHPHGATEQQVAKGLAGAFLLDDPTSTVAGQLPHAYGVDDVPVILQGRAFSGGEPSTGHLPRPLSTTGILGDQALANGRVGA